MCSWRFLLDSWYVWRINQSFWSSWVNKLLIKSSNVWIWWRSKTKILWSYFYHRWIWDLNSLLSYYQDFRIDQVRVKLNRGDGWARIANIMGCGKIERRRCSWVYCGSHFVHLWKNKACAKWNHWFARENWNGLWLWKFLDRFQPHRQKSVCFLHQI